MPVIHAKKSFFLPPLRSRNIPLLMLLLKKSKGRQAAHSGAGEKKCIRFHDERKSEKFYLFLVEPFFSCRWR